MRDIRAIFDGIPVVKDRAERYTNRRDSENKMARTMKVYFSCGFASRGHFFVAFHRLA